MPSGHGVLRGGSQKKMRLENIPKFSRYSVTLLFYRFFEVCARMGSLACIGIVLSGWAIGAILLFDWCFVVVTGWATLVYDYGKMVLETISHMFYYSTVVWRRLVVAFIGVFPTICQN